MQSNLLEPLDTPLPIGRRGGGREAELHAFKKQFITLIR